MMLISEQLSWNELNNVFKEYYENDELNVNVVNFKQALFSIPNTKKIFYAKSLGTLTKVMSFRFLDDDARVVIGSSLQGTLQSNKFCDQDLVLHAPSNIIFAPWSNLFLHGRRVFVPDKNGYIEFLELQLGRSLTEQEKSQIIEGNEFTPIEEVSQNDA